MGSQHSGLLEWQNIQENASEQLDEARLAKLMQALRRLGRLQRQATSASVGAREKKREISFKRQDAWMSDAKFMAEIQRLGAHGEFDHFEVLKDLASQCQIARDGLGPLEQEGIETEQEWEGHIWNLRQAEEQLSSEFEHEFRIAESCFTSESDAEYSSSSSSSDVDGGRLFEIPWINHDTIIPSEETRPATTHFIQLPEFELQIGGQSASHLLLGLAISDEESRAHGDSSLHSYSGIDDIDEDLGGRKSGNVVNIPDLLPKASPNNFELYPQLLTEFISRRERINKWLEYTLQVSHLDGISMFSILKDRLKTEDKLMPSNWSQLVIAFWGFDEAALPGELKLEVNPDVEISGLENQNSQQNHVPLSCENSQQTLHPLNLQSRRSWNTDHGYFSDTSKEKQTHSTSDLDHSKTIRGNFQNVIDGAHKSLP